MGKTIRTLLIFVTVALWVAAFYFVKNSLDKESAEKIFLLVIVGANFAIFTSWLAERSRYDKRINEIESVYKKLLRIEKENHARIKKKNLWI